MVVRDGVKKREGGRREVRDNMLKDWRLVHTTHGSIIVKCRLKLEIVLSLSHTSHWQK